LLGVHSGFTEEQIDNFSFMFYRGCLKELYYKFTFDGIKAVTGNAYVKDSGKIITEYNPMNIDDIPKNQKRRMTKADAIAFMGQQNKK